MLTSPNRIFGLSIAVLLTSLVIMSFLPMTSFAASASPITAPVYITFDPNPANPVHGTTFYETLFGNNTGSVKFTATSCTLWYRLGTSGTWKKVSSCFPNAPWPVKIPAHHTDVGIESSQVADNFPAGIIWQYKLVANGFYGTKAAVSHAGILTVHSM